MFARFTKNNLNEIPLANQTMGKHVPAVMAALVYLLCMVIVAVCAVSDSLVRWDAGVSNKISVEIPVQRELDRARLLPPIISYLKSVPGMVRVDIIDQARMQELSSSWAGKINGASQGPLPVIVDIDTDPQVQINVADLTRDLMRFDPGVRIEAHARWLDSIKGLRAALQGIALVFASIIALAVVSIVTLVTKTGLAAYDEIISTLRLMGAKNSYIAVKFQQNATSLTCRGAIKGYVLAFLTVIVLNNINLVGALPEYMSPSFSFMIFIYMAIAPLFSLILSYVIARFAVLRSLATVQ